MKQAAVIRQSNGMSRHDALVTAHRIGKLIRQMHHETSVSDIPSRMEPSVVPPAHSSATNIVSAARTHRNRRTHLSSITTSMPKAGAPFMLKIFWISKWNESTGKKDEPAGKRMNLLKKKMNLQEKGMNQQERKEWEALCRQYNVDSLQEAIQGCREELEFLIHCAERLEPPTEEDEDSKKRRLTHTGNAAFPH